MVSGLAFIAISAMALPAYAQAPDIPAIERQTIYPQTPGLPERPEVESDVATQRPGYAVPAGAEEIVFVLNDIQMEGASAYDKEELAALWRDSLGREISLADIYRITHAITKKYQDNGYFLSRAYLPAQSIDNGIVRIAVIEGYIGSVDRHAVEYDSLILDSAYRRLLSYRPLRISELERELLLLEDLAGIAMRGILGPMPAEAEEGAVLLSLVAEETDQLSMITRFDNSGSKFVGPNMGSVTGIFESPELGFSQTSVNVTTSLPMDELKYGMVEHRIPFFRPDLYLSLQASYSRGHPGYRLKANDIETASKYLSGKLTWKAIRQRRHNLDLSVGIDWRNSRTDILDQILTRDYIRSATLAGRYEFQDGWNGANIIDFSYSKGLDILSASQKGDANLSRAQGYPDFNKFNATIYRFQSISPEWNVLAGLTGQYSRDPLLSAQEFGYGGQSFGRAYDYSELVGDKGVAATVEVRYDGVEAPADMSIQPFLFYDIGKVWNYDPGQDATATGASIGVGVRANYADSLQASLTAAQPLTRSQDTPAYGNARSPRFLFSLSLSF